MIVRCVATSITIVVVHQLPPTVLPAGMQDKPKPPSGLSQPLSGVENDDPLIDADHSKLLILKMHEIFTLSVES